MPKLATKETPAVSSPPSILFRGKPGTYKTTLALQFPNPGILDCDENVAPVERYLRAQLATKDLQFLHSRCRYTKEDKPIATDDYDILWPRFVEEFNALVLNPWCKTIIIDSLTGLDQMLLRWIMKKQGIQDVMKLDRQHWIPFRMTMTELTLRMRQTGKIMIITAHENEVVDSKGGVIGYNTALTTRLRDNFGWIFTDVYWFEPQPPLQGNRRPPIIHPYVTDGYRTDLKNSFIIQENLLGTYATLNKFMKFPPSTVYSEGQ